MTRKQRRWHAMLWPGLAAVIALVAWAALDARARHLDALAEAAARAETAP
jgi:hypothetical protein